MKGSLTSALALMMSADVQMPAMGPKTYKRPNPLKWGKKKWQRYDKLVADGYDPLTATDIVETYKGEIQPHHNKAKDGHDGSNQGRILPIRSLEKDL